MTKSFGHNWKAFLGIAIAMATLGCVREITSPQPERSTVLTVVKTRGGIPELSFFGEQGKRYMLMYREQVSGDKRYIPLPGAESIVGQGRQITFQDKAPRAQFRQYKVRALIPATRQQIQDAQRIRRSGL